MSEKPNAPLLSPKPKPVPIVGIGSSAGGLEAMTQLLKSLPTDTGMAFVYIQHLDPTHKSMLSSILGRLTDMPVLEAEDLMQIAPNHIYVIPPNKSMESIDGVLTLDTRKAKPVVQKPIDRFFISLAERQMDAAIAVVLSGTGNDGTLGLKTIKNAGGMTIVQDESAKFPGMPQSAIAEDVVDLVLPPDKIAEALVRVSKHIPPFEEIPPEGSSREKELSEVEEGLKNVLQVLKKSTGMDFSHYKTNTILRRINRRMLLNKTENWKDYLGYLKNHAAEVPLLHNDLLINVTSFFRNDDTMDYLNKTLLPQMLLSKTENDVIRIWVPACSTGEEAYSLAIVLAEVLNDKVEQMTIQIFATDLSEMVIAKARKGVYAQNDMAGVSAARKKRFFTKTDKGYRIAKSIRDRCVFAVHNISKDPPFARLDLISCCNLFIYMNTALQKKIIAMFHYALNPNGYLILGKSETIGASGSIFAQVDKKLKIYARKNDTLSRTSFERIRSIMISEQEELNPQKPAPKIIHPTDTLEKKVDDLLLQRYVSPHIIVNQDLEILQFRGATGLFLEPASGKASLNLLKMARPELVFELRNALSKAEKSGLGVKKGGLPIKVKDKTYQIALEVVPIKAGNEEIFFLILFSEDPQPLLSENRPANAKDRRVEQLEKEINAMREDMRSITEEQEASNEELQSANEEIVSSNEELQTLNEELETGKEEIEASNEELMATNQELHVRNQELSEVYEFSEAVLTTLRESFLVLDKDLRVKMANKVFYDTFKVNRKETEGRKIYELGNRQWDIPKLRLLLEDIIPKNSQFYEFEVIHAFPDIGEKILLLNANKISQKAYRQEMIILAIEDVTALRKAQQLAAFSDMANNAPMMIWVAAPDKAFTFFSHSWLEFTGRSMEQETGSGWMKSVHPDDLEAFKQAFNTHFDERHLFQIEYRLRRHDGEYRWLLGSGKPAFSPNGKFNGYIGTSIDIDVRKMHNEALNARAKEHARELLEANLNLERSNQELQQFAYIASHDLQEPLRKIMTFADRLQKRFASVLPVEGKDYVLRMTASAKRMSVLIDELLNFSRVSKQEKTFYKTDLNKILDTVLLDFDLLITQKKAKVKIEALPVLQAIPLQMKQLFHNLLSNALKFSSSKPPKIIISAVTPNKEEVQQLTRGEDPASYCKITVQDNGIGFEPHFATKIFEIFQRLHDKQQYAGTGIGLALCRRIINNHGGDIYAKSVKGAGSTFEIIMPLEQPVGVK